MASAATLSDGDIYALALGAGWTGNDAVIATAIALAESGGNPAAVNNANSNGTNDKGLWQINSIHTQILATGNVFDGAANARMAHTIYAQARNRFTPWSTFNNRRYALFMSRATAASANPGSALAISGDRRSGGGEIPAPELDAFSAETWKRVGMFIAGLVLLMIVVGGLIAGQSPIGQIIKKVAK